jgi:two-component system, NtrC family, sensor kinase
MARTILYVDDESPNLLTFSYLFAERFDIVTVGSGAEALAVMERRPVAVLLADQRMPAMTGVELCAAARERFPSVVRMIVTGYSDIGAAVGAINSGQVSRYILKPWREEELAEILNAAIEAHELGVMVRDVQARMLKSEQQATSSFLLGRALHELSQPLEVALVGSGYVADCLGNLQRTLTAVPNAQREMLEDVRAAAQETAAAVRQAAERLHRFRAGEAPVARGDIATDLNRAVEAALAILGQELRRQGGVQVQLGTVPPVAVDATELSQIIMNLLTNAAEAVAGAPPEARSIIVRTRARPNRAVVEVEDTGPGIAPDLLPRIFEPFVSTKSDDVERGFGLAIVHDLVQRLEGDIRVRSELGRGSCFTVELPVARRP